MHQELPPIGLNYTSSGVVTNPLARTSLANPLYRGTGFSVFGSETGYHDLYTSKLNLQDALNRFEYAQGRETILKDAVLKAGLRSNLPKEQVDELMENVTSFEPFEQLFGPNEIASISQEVGISPEELKKLDADIASGKKGLHSLQQDYLDVANREKAIAQFDIMKLRSAEQARVHWAKDGSDTGDSFLAASVT